jgi:hypothetical protein
MRGSTVGSLGATAVGLPVGAGYWSFVSLSQWLLSLERLSIVTYAIAKTDANWRRIRAFVALNCQVV